MRLRISYIFLLLLLSLISYAQSPSNVPQDRVIKEQRTKLEKNGEDTDALVAIIHAYRNKQDLDSILFFINRLENVATKRGDNRLLIFAYSMKGQALSLKGSRDESIKYLNSAISMAKENDCDSMLFSAYNGLGIIYVQDSDYYLSLNYFF